MACAKWQEAICTLLSACALRLVTGLQGASFHKKCTLHIQSICMQILIRLYCVMQWFTDFATCPPKEAMDLPFGQVHEGFALALGLESSDSWDPADDPLLPARKVCTS